MVVISTGSRTPLLALTVTVIWLATCQGNRRSVVAIGIVLPLLLHFCCYIPKNSFKEAYLIDQRYGWKLLSKEQRICGWAMVSAIILSFT